MRFVPTQPFAPCYPLFYLLGASNQLSCSWCEYPSTLVSGLLTTPHPLLLLPPFHTPHIKLQHLYRRHQQYQPSLSDTIGIQKTSGSNSYLVLALKKKWNPYICKVNRQNDLQIWKSLRIQIYYIKKLRGWNQGTKWILSMEENPKVKVSCKCTFNLLNFSKKACLTKQPTDLYFCQIYCTWNLYLCLPYKGLIWFCLIIWHDPI